MHINAEHLLRDQSAIVRLSAAGTWLVALADKVFIHRINNDVFTSERIRDKIAASKGKGLWVGGPLPLGYQSFRGSDVWPLQLKRNALIDYRNPGEPRGVSGKHHMRRPPQAHPDR